MFVSVYHNLLLFRMAISCQYASVCLGRITCCYWVKFVSAIITVHNEHLCAEPFAHIKIVHEISSQMYSETKPRVTCNMLRQVRIIILLWLTTLRDDGITGCDIHVRLEIAQSL